MAAQDHLYQLTYGPVDLYHPGFLETADRWAMAGWGGDDEDPGFLDATGCSLSDAQRWAKRILLRTSDYRVVAWTGHDSTIPVLEIERHTIKIWTLDFPAGIAPVNVTGRYARWAIRLLGEPDSVISVEQGLGKTLYIPVRAVTGMVHEVVRVPVNPASTN